MKYLMLKFEISGKGGIIEKNSEKKRSLLVSDKYIMLLHLIKTVEQR